MCILVFVIFFFFKQKTAYEMRISDWSSDVCSSDLIATRARGEINLVDGHYKAYGQDLTIETGKLIFSGGPVTEPALEVRATRKPTEDVTVGLYVRGTRRKPDFQLFSTPPMPHQQQHRSEGRRVGKEGGSQGKKRRAPTPK